MSSNLNILTILFAIGVKVEIDNYSSVFLMISFDYNYSILKSLFSLMFSFFSADLADESQPRRKITQQTACAGVKSEEKANPSYVNVNYNSGYHSHDEGVVQ